MVHGESLIKRAVVFVAIAYGGAWLAVSPLWISGLGLTHPLAFLFMIIMMAMPAVAALITHRVLPNGPGFLVSTGLRPAYGFGRWWVYLVIAWLGPILASVLAFALALGLGLFRADFVEFSGLAATVASQPNLPPINVLVLLSAVQVLAAPMMNVLPALGEELGWRGFLQPLLGRKNQWLGAGLTGIVWGLWHAPVILLGYNYPQLPPLGGLAMMCGFCILLSVLFGWLRAASGTVWVPAVAHASLNGSASIGVLAFAAGQRLDTTSTGLLGWSGWIVLAAAIMILVLTRRFPVQ